MIPTIKLSIDRCWKSDGTTLKISNVSQDGIVGVEVVSLSKMFLEYAIENNHKTDSDLIKSIKKLAEEVQCK